MNLFLFLFPFLISRRVAAFRHPWRPTSIPRFSSSQIAPDVCTRGSWMV